jgi:hypothetical protein
MCRTTAFLQINSITQCFNSFPPKGQAVWGKMKLRMITGYGTRNLCIELVRANLGTCFVYAGLALSELEAGKRALAVRSFGLARSSHGAILRFLGKLEDERHRNEIRTNLVQLEKKLDLLQRQLQPEAV